MARARPYLGEDFRIDGVRAGLNSLYVKGVSLPSAIEDVSVKVEKVRIGYNLLNLRHGFDMEKMAEDILFDHPTITLGPSFLKGREGEKGLQIKFDQRTLGNIERFGRIARIAVRGGEVTILDRDHRPITALKHLEGWLDTRDRSRVEVRLKGGVLNSPEQNAHVEGWINLKGGAFLVTFDLDQYPLDGLEGVWDPGKVDLGGGVVDGKLILAFDGKKPSFNGDLRVSEGMLSLWERVTLEGVNLRAHLSDQDLVLDSAYATLWGSPLTLKGRLVNILSPHYDVRFSAPNLQIAELGGMLLPAKADYLQGDLALRGELKGEWRNPKSGFQVQGRGISVGPYQVNQLKMVGNFFQGRWDFSRIEAELDGCSLRANGSVQLGGGPGKTESEILFHYSLDGDLLSLLPAPKPMTYLAPEGVAFKPCQGTLSGTITAGGGGLKGDGSLNLAVTTAEAFALTGTVQLRNEVATLSLADGGDKFNLEATITNIREKPDFSIEAKSLGVAYSGLVVSPPLGSVLAGKQLNIERAWGNPRNFEVDGSLKDRSRGKEWLFGAKIKSTKKGIDIKGRVRYSRKPYGDLTADFRVLKSWQTLEILSFNLGPFLEARGRWGLGESGEISGSVKMLGVPVERWAGIVFGEGGKDYGGTLKGEFQVDGRREHPQINGRLYWEGGQCHDITGFSGGMILNTRGDRIVLEEFHIDHNGSPLLTGEGTVTTPDGVLDLKFISRRLDGGMLAQALGLGEGLLTGRGEGVLAIQGKTSQPIISGNIGIENGNLKGVPFDSLKLVLGPEKGMLAEPGQILYIRKGRLIKKDQYQFAVAGNIPFSGEEIDLVVNGEGEILPVLLERNPYVKAHKGRGEGFLRLGGTVESPQIGGGSFSFSNGELAFGTVAPEVTDVQGKLSMTEDRFLRIENLVGKIGGRELRISNHPSVSLISESLQPLVLEDLGLNLGVLILETPGKPVPLHIPRLMEEGEIGYLNLVGRGEDEKFYVAGPWEHPHLRGTIKAQGARLTYPFKEVEDKGKFEILRRIYWDLAVVPERNNRYFRQVSGLIDKVDLNLFIDNSDQGLIFNRVVEDGSFYMEGKLRSTRGMIDYLDMNFRVEEFGLEFALHDALPIVYGRARTTFIDTVGFRSDIYLSLYTVDSETGQEFERGKWGEFKFKLSSNNPNISGSQEQILAALGYSVGDLPTKAGGAMAERILIRPLVRPVEKRLERTLGLDVVRFSSQIALNVFEENIRPGTGSREGWIDPRFRFFKRSRLMVGKYLTPDLFLTYTGSLAPGLGQTGFGYGLRHQVDLEYRILPNLHLELEYLNDKLLQDEDRRILLQHSFYF